MTMESIFHPVDHEETNMIFFCLFGFSTSGALVSKRPGVERKKSFIFSLFQLGPSQGTWTPESNADFLPAQACEGQTSRASAVGALIIFTSSQVCHIFTTL